MLQGAQLVHRDGMEAQGSGMCSCGPAGLVSWFLQTRTAGHSDAHSVCAPKQPALPQKAAAANPTAFNLLIDTEAFSFIY